MNSWANLTAACPKSWDKLKLFCENDEKKCFFAYKNHYLCTMHYCIKQISNHDKEPDI